MLAVYFGIKMHLQGGVNRYFVFMTLSAFVMGLFHKGLIVYMFFLVGILMFFSLKPSTGLFKVKKMRLIFCLIMPFTIVALVISSQLSISGLGALSSFINFEGAEFAANYRAHSVEARATYGVELNLSSLFSFFKSSVVLYVYYLFSPFPWQIRNAMDLYAVFESLMRFVLLYYSVKQWLSAKGDQRQLQGLMIILFLSMSFLWALGTTNYGTAIRHHMLTWWILVVLGVPSFMDALKHIFFIVYHRKHSSPVSLINVSNFDK